MALTPDENRTGWLSQKAKIGSEPTALSYGHHIITSVLDPMFNVFDTTMRALPLELGFVSGDWQTITDVEIFKKAGSYDVDKMRLIQLMPAEFNMNKLIEVLQERESRVVL